MASLGADIFAPALLAPIAQAGSHLATDHVDVALEELSADNIWPLPKYYELLFLNGN